MKLSAKIGDTFHELTILSGPIYKNNRAKYWHCRCSCGTEKEVGDYQLRAGSTKTCGKHRVITEQTKRLLSKRRKKQAPPNAGRTFSPEARANMQASQAARRLREQANKEITNA